MKGTLRRRILSTFLSLAMIISMLGISVITVSAVTDDRVVEIHIKDVVRDNSFAADLVNEINQQRAQLGTNWPALKLDTLIEEEAMVRAAELPILTSKVDLLFRSYDDDPLEGCKYIEAVVKTTSDNAYDVIQEILNDPMQASTIKDQKVTELGVGVITINEDTGTKFVCIRTTNEKSKNDSLQEMSVTALRNKGTQALKDRGARIWEVPYLPINPADIGRVYEPVVRINSQSGKGGVAFIMSTYYGFKLPKGMHREFADVVQRVSEKTGEVPPDQIMDLFRSEYLYKNEPLHFRKLQVTDMSSDSKTDFDTKIRVVFTDHGKMEQVEAVGNGPLDAVLRGLSIKYGFNARILDYEEHALKSGSDSQAAAYIHLMDAETGRITYGVGVSSNITRASVRAIFSAVNRLQLGDKRPGISDSF